MSKEFLHLLDLIEQGIEVNSSQIKHCQNMQKVIEEMIVPEMDPDYLLAAGAILGWGLGTSSVYIKGNMDKLISILEKLDLDLEPLRLSNEPMDSSPGESIDIFTSEYIKKAELQIKALRDIKKYLLADDFDTEKIKSLYSDAGRKLLEKDFEESLNKLLREK